MFAFKLPTPLGTVPKHSFGTFNITPSGAGGRPFEIDGVQTHAKSVPGNAWHDGASPDVDDLTPIVRAHLTDRWLADAAAEHASVAAFARIALQLLALGAPPHLVERAHRAALDEIRHARLCYTLASAYAGRALTPDAFPLPPALDMQVTFAELACESFRNGCIGEAVAAAEAAWGAAHATEPVVADVLRTITADESRHAELSWEMLAFALEAGGVHARSALAAHVASTAADHVVDVVDDRAPQPDPVDLRIHGRPDAVARRAARAAIITASVERAMKLLAT